MVTILPYERRLPKVVFPPSAKSAARFFGLSVPDQFTRFRLKRRRQGTEIWFVANLVLPQADGTTIVYPFRLNVSSYLDVWPATFSEARRWVARYARQQKMVLEEITRERRQHTQSARDSAPSGLAADLALERAGGCREAWLSSQHPVLWAAAAVRCRHPALHCAYDGACVYGDCNMQMLPQPAQCDDEDD